MVSEISALDFCSKGFFPKELPPCFNSDSFNQKTLNALGAEKKNKVSHYARHNLARAGTLRRRLGIPNPINHAWVARCVEENWKNVQEIFDRSDFSCSKPVEGRAGNRAFHGEPQSKRVDHRADICSTARFLVKADISRFYHSIYTHSLPWAIHTKACAKGNRKGSLWGNRLDRMFRNLADQQTVGIPIGPDISQICAELILCRIDEGLKQKFPTLKGFRFIDDYELAVDSMSHGEEVLCELQNLLNDYELELNPLKTDIHELPIPFEEPWVHQLRRPSLNSGRSQRNSIIELFDLAFVQQRLSPRSGVLRYALRRLAEIRLLGDNHELCEQLVCQCAVVEPSTMRYGFHVLEKLHLRKYKFRYFFEAMRWIVKDASQKGHGSELCWVLYALLRFRKQLPAGVTVEIGDSLKRFNDPCAMLLAVQCVDEGLIGDDLLNTDQLGGFLCAEELWQQNWLFAYEGGMMLGNADYLDACEYFSVLKKNGVRFFSEVAECKQEEIKLPELDEEYG